MEQIKIKNIIKKLNEIISFLESDQILNIIKQIISITGQIVETEKYSDIVNDLRSVKNNINNIYSFNLNYSKTIKEIIDTIKENDIKKNRYVVRLHSSRHQKV